MRYYRARGCERCGKMNKDMVVDLINGIKQIICKKCCN